MSEKRESGATQKTIRTELAGQGLDEIIAAIRSLEMKASKTAFQAGFHAGWDEATKAIQSALKRGDSSDKTIVRIEGVEVSVRPKDKASSEPLGRVSETTNLIFATIQSQRGLRGIEIFQYLQKDGRSILERTVRTVLWRLKVQGKIKSVSGRWYVSDDVPSAE